MRVVAALSHAWQWLYDVFPPIPGTEWHYNRLAQARRKWNEERNKPRGERDLAKLQAAEKERLWLEEQYYGVGCMLEKRLQQLNKCDILLQNGAGGDVAQVSWSCCF